MSFSTKNLIKLIKNSPSFENRFSSLGSLKASKNKDGKENLFKVLDIENPSIVLYRFSLNKIAITTAHSIVKDKNTAYSVDFSIVNKDDNNKETEAYTCLLSTGPKSNLVAFQFDVNELLHFSTNLKTQVPATKKILKVTGGEQPVDTERRFQ